MAIELGEEDFEKLVGEELDKLPDNVVEELVNVAILVQDRPDDGSLDLLGLYDGIAITRRSEYGFGELPDRILIFREPLLAISSDLDALREQIHITLVHEIGHYYGIDDAELEDLGWG